MGRDRDFLGKRSTGNYFLSSFSETNMAACSVLKRSVLDVDGKSFDVLLSHTSLSWGHAGIEEYGLGKKIKYFCNVFNANS